MNISLTVNGEKILLQSPADSSLLSVLRKQKLLQVKRGCEKGTCGSCIVLMNKVPVPACKIPVAFAMDSEIVTLEYFSRSEVYFDMYSDIMKGFSRAGIKLCGFCNSGKIFAAKAILDSSVKPTRAMVYEQIKTLSPCCTDCDTLTNGILYAFEFHVKRKGLS